MTTNYAPSLKAKAAAELELRRRQRERQPITHQDAVTWIQSEFYIPETGAPIQLVSYQLAVLNEALRRDTNGDFAYSLVLWSDIKKSAKSTIAAAAALYLAWHTPYESVRIVGNDLKQADSRTFFYIKRAIELNPRLRDQCAVKNYQIVLPNRTSITAIPVDPKGEAGGGDLIICFTELWAAKNKAAQALWSETTLSPLKFGKSIRWAESYAGFEAQSPILEQLYDEGVNKGQVVDVGIPGLELYRNKRLLALWNTQPRCPWQTEEYYEQERSTLDADEFARLHRNQWSRWGGLIYPDFSAVEGGNVTTDADYHASKGSVYWGGDDGFAEGKGPGSASYHPRVVLLGQRNKLGGMDIFQEYYKTRVANYQPTIEEVLAYGYPRPESAYVDSSAQRWIWILANEYDIYTVGATHEVAEGIKHLRSLICDANGVRKFRIHPRCVNLIRELSRYRLINPESSQSKGGEQAPLKVDDHGADAARYLTFPLRME